MTQIKQINYNTWGEGTNQYWRDMNNIAAYIATRLVAERPRCNGRTPRVSTITVEQHKEKFGKVVVYCTLADINEVSEKWAELGNDGDPDDLFIQLC